MTTEPDAPVKHHWKRPGIPKMVQSPLVRISFGLAMLTVSLLFVSEFIGLVPNKISAELEFRKSLVESLAVQLSAAISNRELSSVKDTLLSMVKRNSSVLSAAVRLQNDKVLFQSEEHDQLWTLKKTEKSTPTQIQVSIYENSDLWGGIELSFTELGAGENSLFSRQSYLMLVLFVGLLGFFSYMFFLKRTMHELNTDNVIPERVRNALDTLTEGLIIVDQSGYIVFANSAIARILNMSADECIGKKSTEFDWEYESNEANVKQLPWMRMLEGKKVKNGERVNLNSQHQKTYFLTVNISIIGGGNQRIQGALITFDDVSEIVAKNEELGHTLGKLEKTQTEVTRQNKELHKLATRDSMTDCLNRRTLFLGLEELFNEAKSSQDPFSFIMVDIDHFKAVNDTYGHTTGDQVIVFLANCLKEHAREMDLVGRFGGEEFCVILPGANLEEGGEVAERIRLLVQNGHGGDYTEELKITASFGVSQFNHEMTEALELVETADEALYKAKEGGRNQVILWRADEKENSTVNSINSVTTNDGTEPEVTNPQNAINDDKPEVNETESHPAKCESPSPTLTHDQVIQTQSDNNKFSELPMLPNSILLLDRIDQAIIRSARYKTKVAVLVLDIDVLQRVNDALGLMVGEKFYAAIVARLKKILRDTDTVTINDENKLSFSISSLGRRDMVLLLTDLADNDCISIVLQRLFQSQNDPIVIESHEFYLNTNIGVSLFPLDGKDSSTLIKNATTAKMEAMKAAGESNFCFYTEKIDQQSRERIQLEADLYKALERKEFVVYYQPKVALHSGDIVGFEALLRWQHPQNGLVFPDKFISVAEQTGLIEEVSQWVIKSVCRQIGIWHRAGYTQICVSINLSPVEFRNPELAEKIIQSVKDSGIRASALEIEITESIALDDMNNALVCLERISKEEISISVDDFGTGYASLSYLQRLPINKIKIDRSFVSGILHGSNDATIVSAIIAMGHTLGLEVIAEGVETEEQLRFLQDMHCDEIQGYLISRPVPIEQIDTLLSKPYEIKHLVLSNMAAENKNLSDLTFSMLSAINNFPENEHKYVEKKAS